MQMGGMVVIGDQIGAEIVARVTPYGMDMIGIVLYVVILYQEL